MRLLQVQIIFALATAPSLVGVTGFEPAAFWSRTKRSTKLSHTPKKNSIKNTVTKSREYAQIFEPNALPVRCPKFSIRYRSLLYHFIIELSISF